MHPYLISLLILLGATALTWTPLAIKAIGIFDIIPNIFRTAQNRIFSIEYGNGLGIIAFAFLIYALVESKVLQSFFVSTASEKWKKRRNWVIIILTITTSLLTTFLFWYDEYIHFFPLIIPLFLTMGLDGFSSFLCLFGGAAAGLLSSVSPLHQTSNTNLINAELGGRTNFKGADGIGFRLVCWLIFTTIFVLFNLWYSNKIYRRAPSSNFLETTKSLPKEIKSAPKLSKAIKWTVIATFGFFVAVSFLATIPWFADKEKGLPTTAERKEEKEWKDMLSSSYPAGIKQGPYPSKETYRKIGTTDKEAITHDPKDKGQSQFIAKVGTEATEKFWPKFGSWGNLQVCSWFVIGAIIICLLSKQSIVNTLIATGKKTFPILVGYTLLATTTLTVKESGISDTLASCLSSEKVTKHANVLALFGVFFLIFLVVLMLGTHGGVWLALVPTLYAVSANTVLYAAMIASLAGMLAMFIRPDPILMNGLEASGSNYKEYLKKTWPLWTIIFLISLLLVGWCAFYCT